MIPAMRFMAIEDLLGRVGEDRSASLTSGEKVISDRFQSVGAQDQDKCCRPTF